MDIGRPLKATWNTLPAAAFAGLAAYGAANGVFTEPVTYPDTSKIQFDERAGTATVPIYRAPLFGEVQLFSNLNFSCLGTTAIKTEQFVDGSPTDTHFITDSSLCEDRIISPKDFMP